ncbi:MAG TPA: metallophosphoesterase [Niabella sp.]
MRLRFFTLPIYVLIIVSIYSCAPSKFTIPVLPDTQEAVTRRHDLFNAQLHWIVKAKDSLRIPIVLHVGDLVNFDTIPQYERTSTAFEELDRAGIPYVITLGNHDGQAVQHNSGSAAPGNVNANLRKTDKFNHYFPVSRFRLQQGRYEEGKSDNSYQIFKAGGKKFLVITLEFCAREGAAQWMDQVMKTHPKYNVIVLTHYHLTPKGEIAKTNAGYGDMKVADIFDKYIKPNKNAFMVLSGHVCFSSHREDMGTGGNRIYQILSDYQCKDDGGGYIRLLDFDLKKKTIAAKMYSPFYNKTLDDDSRFVLTGIRLIK